MMPLEFSSAVIALIELFHFRNVILQFARQRDGNPLRRPGPSARVQDLDVDVIGDRGVIVSDGDERNKDLVNGRLFFCVCVRPSLFLL